MIALLGIIAIKQPLYLVADAYYAAGKIVKGLRAKDNHLVTRVKSNAVAGYYAQTFDYLRGLGLPVIEVEISGAA